MPDDFRIAVEFEEDRHGIHFGRRLGEREFEKDVRRKLGDGVLVTRDGPNVYLYAATQEQAEAAEKAVQLVLAEDHMRASVSPVLRWHPTQEHWEDASKRLPQTSDEKADEHERWEEQQAEEARDLGYAEWE